MFTVVTVEGNLTADPVLRAVPAEPGRGADLRGRQAAQVANLRIAVSERERDARGIWVSTEPVFYDVAVWGSAAPHAAALRAGDRVVVHGELTARSWTGQDGQVRCSSTITAAMVGASLRYVPVQPARG